MILYWNKGKRLYGKNPIPVYRRVGWEFQLFLSGSCRLARANGTMEPITSRSLWVFPPTTAHGWSGELGSECEIRVVHFSRVREPLGELCSRWGLLHRELGEEEVRRLKEVFQQTEEVFQRKSVLLELYTERLLIELTLAVLPEEVSTGKGAFWAGEERLVYGAISYFRDHMHEAIKIEEVAKEVSVSTPHLRRLFHKVKGISPRAWFQEERFKRAEEMLRETTFTVERIAEACGFESAGSFIRTFRRKYGMTPGQFRIQRT